MSVIDDYFQRLTAPERDALERVRQIVKQVAPEAEEVITYAMPGFKYHKKYLVAFAEFKDHLSVFPGAEAVDVLQDQLAGFTTSKGTIQFTIENPLPESLIREMISLRMTAISK